MGIHIRSVENDNDDLITLVYALTGEMHKRYGIIQKESKRDRVLPDITYAVVAYRDGEPVASGALMERSDTVEIKHIYVSGAYRRMGIAVQVVAALEQWARDKGCVSAILETGDKQPEAIGLYRKMGYTVIPNFEPYVGMDDSICMKKIL